MFQSLVSSVGRNLGLFAAMKCYLTGLDNLQQVLFYYKAFYYVVFGWVGL